MRKLTLLVVTGVLWSALSAKAQGLPDEMYLSPDLRILYTGGRPATNLYDDSQIRRIDLFFLQTNYWTQLTNNYNSKTDLPATMSIDGLVLDSVGVRFKGQTSYSGLGSSQKKSFNLTLNKWISGQDVDGYNILNLNNCFDDASFLAEFFYLRSIRRHIPAAKDAYVKLYINGANWGLYGNVQQLNKDFYKEWFMSNNGTNWRADRPSGGGGGWGDGTAALNYLSADTTIYKTYYTLKSSDKTNPWQDLVNTCYDLNTTPLANIDSVLPRSLDIDRTLWFLASEIAFSDDDSYIYKGKMDYYCYWEAETGRITPIEFDGNSAMKTSRTGWSPFYNQTNANYPLMNRLFAVPALRQRYLAHMRTIIKESLDTTTAYPVINNYVSMIDTIVQNDPKKVYTYANFTSTVQSIKNYVRDRRAYLLANAEVAMTGPEIADVNFYSSGMQGRYPDQTDSVLVTAVVTSGNGIDRVMLYSATGIVGNFSKSFMFDDGLHGDGAAGDGVYGAWLPARSSGTWVRFYVEAASANADKTVSYSPEGAEHNVYVYFVNTSIAANVEVVINEVMASNTTTAQDDAGEYDDWIEFYNPTTAPVDLSGYTLTDDSLNLDKWTFPAGTIINPNEYLIVWADEDGSQGPYHCNFKLSSSGEDLLLLNPSLELVDRVTFGAQQTDRGYARVPNGSGPFVIQAPTFAANNNLTTSVSAINTQSAQLLIYPNPAADYVRIYGSGKENTQLEIVDMVGQVLYQLAGGVEHQIISSSLPSGIYLVRYGNSTRKLVIKH